MAQLGRFSQWALVSIVLFFMGVSISGSLAAINTDKGLSVSGIPTVIISAMPSPALGTSTANIGAVDLRVASAAVATSNPIPTQEQAQSLTFSYSNVSLGNSSTSLIASNASRKSLAICNDSDTKIYIHLAGGTASATAGLPVAAGGCMILSAGEKFFTTSAITGITATGSSKSINVAEGV